MAGISQINASYLPAEDRMLLRVSSQAGEEFRFWLTRRVVVGLVTAFDRGFDALAENLTPDDLPGRAALRDFKREQFTSQGDFSQGYDDSTEKICPLGETALLVIGVNLQFIADGALLNLSLVDGRNLRLQLNVHLLGGFHRLLLDTGSKADWQLQNPIPATEFVPLLSPVLQ